MSIDTPETKPGSATAARPLRVVSLTAMRALIVAAPGATIEVRWDDAEEWTALAPLAAGWVVVERDSRWQGATIRGAEVLPLRWEAGPPFEDWVLLPREGGLLLVQSTEVSNTQFRAFLSAGGNLGESSAPLRATIDFYPSHPVVGIDWQGARDYCRWRALRLLRQFVAGECLRLPRQLEWQAAAEGIVVGTDFPPGFEPGLGPRPCGSNPRDISHAGAQDLAGNVAEWSEDLVELSDPSGGPRRRLVLGGSWADAAGERTAAKWGAAAPNVSASTIGFRPIWWIPLWSSASRGTQPTRSSK